MSARCEVAARSPEDMWDDVEPCGDPAPFGVTGWGYGPGRDGLNACSHHAWHALDDGALVTGPNGSPCRFDEDEGIVEVDA